MTDLTVASWNIRAGLGRDFRRRPSRTIDAIVDFDADVVLLQEADFRIPPRHAALPRMQGRIGPFEVIDLTPSAVGLGWHGIAMLKRPGTEVGAIHLHDLPALEPRGVVIVDLTVRGVAVRIVGVHLGLLRGNRRKQISFIVARLAELDHRPTVIAGDYNEWRDQRGFEAVPDWLCIHSPGPTFPAGRPFLNLDRLVYSRDLELLSSGVIAGPNAIMASDHRPIIGQFRHLSPRDAVRAAGSE
ncbi:metal-dependent hydrolase [Tabrizicola sp. WMC-M-20]|nr:metal-dependent hydrolase [Tabrizicola sp. WMC-M-20]